jgi:hypothetical protein
MLAVAAAVVIVAFVVTTWLLSIAKPGTDRANSRLDAVRTGGGESAEPASLADQGRVSRHPALITS